MKITFLETSDMHGYVYPTDYAGKHDLALGAAKVATKLKKLREKAEGVVVTIENGEGYYNLFATNTKSSLLKGISEKALPYYIVTINCKTGYFRGNGNDHTIR